MQERQITNVAAGTQGTDAVMYVAADGNRYFKADGAGDDSDAAKIEGQGAVAAGAGAQALANATTAIGTQAIAAGLAPVPSARAPWPSAMPAWWSGRARPRSGLAIQPSAPARTQPARTARPPHSVRCPKPLPMARRPSAVVPWRWARAAPHWPRRHCRHEASIAVGRSALPW